MDIEVAATRQRIEVLLNGIVDVTSYSNTEEVLLACSFVLAACISELCDGDIIRCKALLARTDDFIASQWEKETRQ